jgi:hypothetical protein
MSNIINDLVQKKLAHPPAWLSSNTHYLTMMGSVAYGVSSDTSDMDLYGFCLPPKEIVFPHLSGEIFGFGTQKKRFNQWQQHHIKDPCAMQGKGRQYDLTVYNVVDYFNLLMQNNPNMIDSIFTPDNCVLHITRIGTMVREKRRMFLHKKCWHTFKGYAYAQMKKIRNKERESSSRRDLIEKYGYDCYLDSETEFLTEAGWKKYDDVEADDSLAVVDPSTGKIGWENYTERIDKPFSGPMYVVEPAMSRCVVTPNHHMLVSPARRSEATNFSYRYFEDKADWNLVPFSTLMTGSRSWFHTRRRVEGNCFDYSGVTDEYLVLAGLYIAEGTINFRDGKVKTARLTQTPNGKQEFFEMADRIASAFDMKRYDYDKETVWTVERATAEKLYTDFGHGSGSKRLPLWCYKLSERQASILWKNACLGDGTPTPNGEVYYTSNAALAGDVQAMLTCAGVLCSVRGPYSYERNDECFGNCDMYQVYRPSDQYAYSCVDFKNRIQKSDDEATEVTGDVRVDGLRHFTEDDDPKTSWPIKERIVQEERIVCFQVPSGTLITRSKGRVALHGNTKFAYHLVRLMNEVEQIMVEHDLDLMRNREQLKQIRAGCWTEEQLEDYFAKKEVSLEETYNKSDLRWGPDEPAIKELLLNVLEEHYGNLDKCVIRQDAVVTALRNVIGAADEARRVLEQITYEEPAEAGGEQSEQAVAPTE